MMDRLTIKLRQQYTPLDKPIKTKFSTDLTDVNLQAFHEAWVAFLHASGFSPETVKVFYEEDVKCNS